MWSRGYEITGKALKALYEQNALQKMHGTTIGSFKPTRFGNSKREVIYTTNTRGLYNEEEPAHVG
ncbi:hypothetical protein MBOURGENBZM_08320 [Methanoculleus bourgensis]|nr:hypothetical protein MBOURGENBZM_08320 [Methanoculleus bourgensis]